MHKRITLIVSLILFLVLAVGCSRRSNDAKIKQDIQEKTAADPDTKDSEVTVVAKAGKVTLSGKVKTPAAQKKVEQIAQQEPGNTGVDDQTSIEPEAMPAAEAPPVAQASPPPPPPPQPIVVPAGTVLTVRMGQALSSKTSQTGQTFLATLGQPVSVGGRAAIPAGSTFSGTVVTAKSKGKIKGEGELSLALISVTVRGQTYSIHTGVLENTTKGKGKRTAATTGGGAAGGALIGGIAGGGKGAGIGALLGAGAGLVGGAVTGNQQIEIPAESALSFRLSAPLTLPPPGE